MSPTLSRPARRFLFADGRHLLAETPGRGSVAAQLASIETDVLWIRASLTEANLVNRVGALERAQARTQGGIAVALFVISGVLAGAKALGIIH